MLRPPPLLSSTGGCGEVPACKTVLNESDFNALIGQYNVTRDKLGKKL